MNINAKHLLFTLILLIFVIGTLSAVSSASVDDKYLKSSKNCQVNDKSIKSLTKNVTKVGIKTNVTVKYKVAGNKTKTKVVLKVKPVSNLTKAKRIFNYVNKKKSYSFYYNTKYGSKRMIKSKSGNCVDKTHLMIAMFRAAKLPARYAHATCRFSSGSVYGHVYGEVKVNGKWYRVDPTHKTLNKFGVTKSCKPIAKLKRYVSLAF